MFKKSLLLVVSAVVLSGCTIQLPFSVPTPTASEQPTDVFGKKIQAGSVWKSIDSGQTFEVKSRVDDKQAITKADVLALSFHPNDSNILYIATADHGIFKSMDAGEYWEQIVFPPKKIYSFILDRNDPDNRMFASGTIGNLGKIFRTDDGGTEWRAVYTEPGAGVVITILAQHPRDTNVLFAGTSAGTVVKSTDSGETWKNVGQTLDGPITEIAFDAVEPMSIYALSINKKIYYSDNGGVAWTDQMQVTNTNNNAPATTSTGGPDMALSITADPIVSGRLYATKNGGLYRSDDFTRTWNKVNIIESAEKFPVRTVVVNPRNSQEIIFSAGSAFYRSTNGGDTWAVVDLYIDRSVSVLAYDPADSSIIYMALRNIK
jgi:photosystem II stability/assembly factor-like uncharacterized protein